MSAIWGAFKLKLYTPEEFAALPIGMVVIDIFGKPCIKDARMGLDTRGGHVAYGYLEEVD